MRLHLKGCFQESGRASYYPAGRSSWYESKPFGRGLWYEVRLARSLQHCAELCACSDCHAFTYVPVSDPTTASPRDGHAIPSLTSSRASARSSPLIPRRGHRQRPQRRRRPQCRPYGRRRRRRVRCPRRPRGLPLRRRAQQAGARVSPVCLGPIIAGQRPPTLGEVPLAQKMVTTTTSYRTVGLHIGIISTTCASTAAHRLLGRSPGGTARLVILALTCNCGSKVPQVKLYGRLTAGIIARTG